MFQNSSLKLELIFRGSRDGFTTTAFHNKANNQGDTVTLVRTTNGKVFGGYTNIPWTSSGYYKKKDHSSFVFELGDNGQYHKYNSKYG